MSRAPCRYDRVAHVSRHPKTNVEHVHRFSFLAYWGANYTAPWPGSSFPPPPGAEGERACPALWRWPARAARWRVPRAAVHWWPQARCSPLRGRSLPRRAARWTTATSAPTTSGSSATACPTALMPTCVRVRGVGRGALCFAFSLWERFEALLFAAPSAITRDWRPRPRWRRRNTSLRVQRCHHKGR